MKRFVAALIGFTALQAAANPPVAPKAAGCEAPNKWVSCLESYQLSDKTQACVARLTKNDAKLGSIQVDLSLPKDRVSLPLLRLKISAAAGGVDFLGAIVKADDAAIADRAKMFMTADAGTRGFYLAPKWTDQVVKKFRAADTVQFDLTQVDGAGKVTTKQVQLTLSGFSNAEKALKKCLGAVGDVFTPSQLQLMKDLNESGRVAAPANPSRNPVEVAAQGAKAVEELRKVVERNAEYQDAEAKVKGIESDPQHAELKTRKQGLEETKSGANSNLTRMDENDSYAKSAPAQRELLESAAREARVRVEQLTSEKDALQTKLSGLQGQVDQYERTISDLQGRLDRGDLAGKEQRKAQLLRELGLGEGNMRDLQAQLQLLDSRQKAAAIILSRMGQPTEFLDLRDEDFGAAMSMNIEIRRRVESRNGNEFRKLRQEIQDMARKYEINQYVQEDLKPDLDLLNSIESDINSFEQRRKDVAADEVRLKGLGAQDPAQLEAFLEKDRVATANEKKSSEDLAAQYAAKKCKWYKGCFGNHYKQLSQQFAARAATLGQREAELVNRIQQLKTTGKDPGQAADVAATQKRIDANKAEAARELREAQQKQKQVTLDGERRRGNGRGNGPGGRDDRNQRNDRDDRQDGGRRGDGLLRELGVDTRLIQQFNQCQISERNTCLSVIDQLGNNLSGVINRADSDARAVSGMEAKRELLRKMRDEIRDEATKIEGQSRQGAVTIGELSRLQVTIDQLQADKTALEAEKSRLSSFVARSGYTDAERRLEKTRAELAAAGKRSSSAQSALQGHERKVREIQNEQPGYPQARTEARARIVATEKDLVVVAEAMRPFQESISKLKDEQARILSARNDALAEWYSLGAELEARLAKRAGR